jgi:hypothetical protein
MPSIVTNRAVYETASRSDVVSLSTKADHLAEDDLSPLGNATD